MIDGSPLLVPGVSPAILDFVQNRTWERMFHDALYPRLMFRADAVPSMWPANLGQRIAMTRTGLIAVTAKPTNAGADPIPSTYQSEQWEAVAAQYDGTLDTNMKGSYVSLASIFAENTHKLGLHSGQTLNHVARNNLYAAYLGGNTYVDTASGPATTIHVAQMSGFLTAIAVSSDQAAPAPPSVSNPIKVVAPSAAALVGKNVVGAVPDDASNPWGPGTLTLSASVTVVVGDAVIAETASFINRVGGSATVNGLTSLDIFTLQNSIDSVARLRLFNVPAHSDGYYHAHISPITEAQTFRDPSWQRLNTALPDYLHYREQAMGQILGTVFFRNTEVPSISSVFAAETFPWPTINSGSVQVHRPIITGAGVIYEKYLDESMFISEAGVTGKIGTPNVVNNSVQVMTDRVRLILRAPLDRKQEVVTTTWSWSGDFPVPSDLTTGKNPATGASARYKRAVVIEHA